MSCLLCMLDHCCDCCHVCLLNKSLDAVATLLAIQLPGEGQVTYEDFIDGILRCKGPARAIDQTLGLNKKIKAWRIH